MLPTLIRRRPMSHASEPFRDVEEWFERLAPGFWGNGGAASDLTAEYPVDIREDEAHLYVDAEMPGFTKDQVDVTLEAGVLSITAERKEEKANGKEKTHLRERRYSRVERSFTLPSPVDETKVEAKLTDGVLHVTLNKTAESRPRRIAVK